MQKVPKMCRRGSDGLAFATWRENGHKKWEYFGPHGTRKAEEAYSDFRQRWLSAHTDPPAALRSDSTLTELAAAFLDYAADFYRRPDGSQTTEVQEFRRTFILLDQVAGQLPCDDLRPRHFKQLRQLMIEAGLSLGVINQRMGRIRRLMRWGVAEEVVSPSVADALAEVRDLPSGRGLAPELPPIEAVDWPTVEATVRAIRYPELRAIVLFQWHCGCRPGEACRVAGSDIFREGIVPLGRSVLRLPEGSWAYRVRAKMAHARQVKAQIYALGPKARDLLTPWLKEGYLWPSPHRPGRPWTTSGYTHYVARVCLEAGLPHWHPHQLRHAAQQRVEKVYGLEGGRKILGHTGIQSVLTYSQRDLDGAAEIAEKLG